MKSLKEEQEALEKLSLAEAARQFWLKLAGQVDKEALEAGIKTRTKNKISATQVGLEFIQPKIAEVTTCLQAALDKANSKAGGTAGVNLTPFLLANSLEAIAYLALKSVVDMGCRNIQKKGTPSLFRNSIIIHAIGKDVALELEANKAPSEKMPQLADLEHRIAGTTDEIERPKLVRRRKALLNRIAKVNFDDECRARIGLVLYDVLCCVGLLIPGEPREGEYNIPVHIPDEIYNMLRENLNEFANQKAIWGAMVLRPRCWSSNKNGGYHFDLKSRHSLLNRCEWNFDKKSAGDVFSAVNALQETAFHINEKVLNTAKELFFGNKEGVLSSLFNIPQNDHELWLNLSVRKIIAEAERLKPFKRIYYSAYLDFRGRYYCKASFLNPQGTDLCRGMFEFSKPLPIRDDGARRWLCSHGACRYDGNMSHMKYSKREAWVKYNEAMIKSIARNPTSDTSIAFLEKADKPWSFLAWCCEWAEFLKKGMEFQSRLPVAVDGTCNGIQHFAALKRSPALAAEVNLLQADQAGDIYQSVADKVSLRLKERHAKMDWYNKLTLEELFEKYNTAHTLLGLPEFAPKGRLKKRENSIQSAPSPFPHITPEILAHLKHGEHGAANLPDMHLSPAPLQGTSSGFEKELAALLADSEDHNASTRRDIFEEAPVHGPEQITTGLSPVPASWQNDLTRGEEGVDDAEVRIDIDELAQDEAEDGASACDVIDSASSSRNSGSSEEDADGEIIDYEKYMKHPRELSKKRKQQIYRSCRRQLVECILLSPLPDALSPVTLDRKLLKPLVMTFPYSSTYFGNVSVMSDALKAKHADYLSYLRGTNPAQYDCAALVSRAIVGVTREVIREVAADAVAVMDYLRKLLPGKAESPEVAWHSPTGFKVCQRYAATDLRNTINLRYSGVKVRFRTNLKTDKANLGRHARGISPNFVHSCDAAHMMKTVIAAKRKGIKSFLMVHDSFATHAANMTELSRILRAEFVKIYKEGNPLDMLRKELLEQCPAKRGDVRKLKQGDFNIDSVLDSEFFFS